MFEEVYFEDIEANSSTTLVRSKSKLIKPERSKSVRKPMVASHETRIAENFSRTIDRSKANNYGDAQQMKKEDSPTKTFEWNSWTVFVYAITCCFPNFLLRRLGKVDPRVQHAWREKIALIVIIFICCLLLGFFTFLLQSTICQRVDNRALLSSPPYSDAFAIHGYWYRIDSSYLKQQHPISMNQVNQVISGSISKEISALFSNSFDASSCSSVQVKAPPPPSCKLSSGFNYCHVITYSSISGSAIKADANTGIEVAIDWEDVKNPQNFYAVYNGIVLDLRDYLSTNSTFLGPKIDTILRNGLGLDITKQILDNDLNTFVPCLTSKYQVASVSKETPGCFAANVLNTVVLIIIFGLVLVRILMAIIYSCLIAPKLSQNPIGISYIPPGVDVSKIIQKPKNYAKNITSVKSKAKSRFSVYAPVQEPSVSLEDEHILMKSLSDAMKADMLATYLMVLVTCYSEDENGIRATLESIAESSYPSKNTLIFMVADGIVTGGGNDRSTPDICLGLLSLDPTSINPEPLCYVAVADGAKQLNMAKVYAGSFIHNDVSVPTILVVKCGTSSEANEAKPGNRGKRDSQILLMNFLSKVMFDDRMTSMEYDLFTKIHKVSGVTPDRFEILLMVDADTKIMPNSIELMVNAMKNDLQIMGLCGETKIANKAATWVSAIQVYEYFLSHHLAKNFESLFGGVTCLPGCFSAYRLKSPKGSDGLWVPILINPDVVEEYSQNVVETLHQKNLLLLGEDRFLSTLMLKTFPKRNMVFLPQACCKTVVPDKFNVLLSQRRRWINSTVHNLMELVLVKDLCGTFCFSMQFVVLLDLISTVVLPAAIAFTLVLIVSIATPNGDFATNSGLSLGMLLAILVLPAICTIVLTKRTSFFVWLIIYLFALPIWNFVLPVYAFWHFDDFSWGKTRKVAGEVEGEDHGASQGKFDYSKISMKRWEEWEREKRRSMKFTTGISRLSSYNSKNLSMAMQPRNMFPYQNENLMRRVTQLSSSTDQDSFNGRARQDSYLSFEGTSPISTKSREEILDEFEMPSPPQMNVEALYDKQGIIPKKLSRSTPSSSRALNFSYTE